MKLNVKAFSLAAAIFWGGGLFLISWWLIILEGSGGDPGIIGRLYPGYAITPLGSVIGLLWGFVDALISGAIFAWLYNYLSQRVSPGD